MRDGQLLSAALREVRKARGMSARQTAAAMHMSVRTYQRFEAGVTRLNLDHIHRFARATSSDPYAIIHAVMIGSPRYALSAADNMLSTILIIGVQKLEQTLGERVAELDTRSLVSAVSALFESLRDQVLGDDPQRDWLGAGLDDLAARRPRPGR
ncbi:MULTISPECIES: helix-turn-helix domain-containing protein [unclassified Brevundimonas]|uniref:helix-turn-helix domain-containing protein n=1 Tax=unclassified Brevundimonas TaxID=2622653 RepID=UPI0025B8AAB2|nr:MULTISPECIES: helix-turn-helix transcriptional regulator [unclassified Brevundimonas]